MGIVHLRRRAFFGGSIFPSFLFFFIFFFTRINAMNIIVYIALFMSVIEFATARPEGSEMEESVRELEMDDFAQKRMAAQPRQAMEYMRNWCCGNCDHYRARGYNMNSKCCHSPNAFDESKTDVFCCKDC